MMAAQCDAAEHYLRLEAPRTAVHPAPKPVLTGFTKYFPIHIYVLAHAGNMQVCYTLVNVRMHTICVQDFSGVVLVDA